MVELPPAARPVDGRPFISVIVPVFNDPGRLRLCLAALERQTWPADGYEVLVVDNGSEPPQTLKAGEFPHARLLSEPTPGVSRARLLGLTSARGDVLAFTDADCVPDAAWLLRGVAALAGTPNCGLAGGRIVVVPRDPARPNLAESLGVAMHLKQERFLRGGHWAAPANAFTWRRVVDAVGPPKPELFHCEEIEWGRRVHAAGYAQVFAAEAVVTHPARSTVGDLRRRAARLETAWQELRRVEGIGTGAPAWTGQYLVWPLAAIGTDVLANRAIGGWPRRLAVAALALFLMGVRLVAWARQSLGAPPDPRTTWG